MKSQLSNEQLSRIELDRKSYDALASSQVILLDKSIISIAGASFSITIGFIDKLIPLNTAKAIWMLWFSLLILAFSIIVTILSFWCGEKAARFMRDLCDNAEKQHDTTILEQPNPWHTPLIWFNRSRLIFFISGIALLAVFIYYNGMLRAMGCLDN
jgi:hypothetical protein